MTVAPEIKGWCPGARRPMLSGDGLVVRVRPHLSRLEAEQALGLSVLSTLYGNGLIDLTGRANLQLRGVTPDAFDHVLAGLDALGLLDAEGVAEGRRNLIVAPDADSRAYAQAVQRALTLWDGPDLPDKFGCVVDCGAGRLYAGVSGDIRVERGSSGPLVRADGCDTGVSVATPNEAAQAVTALLRAFVEAQGIGPDGRGRMARVAASLPQDVRGSERPLAGDTAPVAGHSQGVWHVAAAFGQLTAEALTHLALLGAPLHITPFRMVRVETDKPVDHPDLITRPDDPLLQITACTGAPGCPQALGDTRALARVLADGQPLHLSGCTKGCAHPRTHPRTLVATETGYDLVIGGAPWDAPTRTGLRADDLRKGGL